MKGVPCPEQGHSSNRLALNSWAAERRLPGFLAALMLLFSFSILAAGAADARRLTIGSISLDPVGEVRAYQPFADFLSAMLRSSGIDGAGVVVAESIDQMARLVREKQVDLFIDSSVSALMVNQLAGSKFLLRRWKEGRDANRSVVVVRANSRFWKFSDLSGETVAFEQPFSTSGFMLPAMAMAGSGLTLVQLGGTAQTPPRGTVGYVMGHDAETQLTWVEREQVAAAAMSEGAYRDLAPTALTPLRVLYASPIVPDHVVVYGAHLEEALVSRIRTVLLNAHNSQHGADVLDDFERTTMFDEIPQPLLGNVMALAPGVLRLMEARAE